MGDAARLLVGTGPYHTAAGQDQFIDVGPRGPTIEAEVGASILRPDGTIDTQHPDANDGLFFRPSDATGVTCFEYKVVMRGKIHSSGALVDGDMGNERFGGLGKRAADRCPER
jgi:hypothetical protein